MEQELTNTASGVGADAAHEGEGRRADPPAPRTRRRRIGRIAGRVGLALLAVVVLFLALTPIGRYLARAGWEEGKILARRQSIVDLVADSSTAPDVRAKLR